MCLCLDRTRMAVPARAPASPARHCLRPQTDNVDHLIGACEPRAAIVEDEPNMAMGQAAQWRLVVSKRLAAGAKNIGDLMQVGSEPRAILRAV